LSAYGQLSEHIAEIADLASVEAVLTWDQLVMMPEQGAGERAHASGALAKLMHERATAPEIGEWLADLDGAELDDLASDVVRIARRDFERAARVPDELAAERASAAAAGQQTWQRARAADDFAAFLPALERNIALAREYAGCVAENGQSAYDALLVDYDYGLTSETVARLFGDLSDELPGLVASAGGAPRPSLDISEQAQRGAVETTLARLGVERSSWRVDASAHPFSTAIAWRDSRLTTRYSGPDVESLVGALHEFGHALYDRQLAPELERTNLAAGLSMSVHESQSKLWENHVARNGAFAEVIAAAYREAGANVTAGEYHAVVNHVEASPIRVSADPASYPLHIVLRFQLEHALIEGDLAPAELPEAWRAKMKELLGLDVTSDAQGCMQDVHWSSGSFGYFPTYAVGCLIAAQLWESLLADTGPLDERLRNCEVDGVKAWLGERIHRYGRRRDTAQLVEDATGRPLSSESFLSFVRPLARA